MKGAAESTTRGQTTVDLVEWLSYDVRQEDVLLVDSSAKREVSSRSRALLADEVQAGLRTAAVSQPLRWC